MSTFSTHTKFYRDYVTAPFWCSRGVLCAIIYEAAFTEICIAQWHELANHFKYKRRSARLLRIRRQDYFLDLLVYTTASAFDSLN